VHVAHGEHCVGRLRPLDHQLEHQRNHQPHALHDGRRQRDQCPAEFDRIVFSRLPLAVVDARHHQQFDQQRRQNPERTLEVGVGGDVVEEPFGAAFGQHHVHHPPLHVLRSHVEILLLLLDCEERTRRLRLGRLVRGLVLIVLGGVLVGIAVVCVIGVLLLVVVHEILLLLLLLLVGVERLLLSLIVVAFVLRVQWSVLRNIIYEYVV